MTEQEEGLSIKEAAELLHVHEKTVRQRIRTGEIHAVKVPRPQGFEWRVYLNGSRPTQVSSPAPQVSTHVDSDPAHMNGPTAPHVSPDATPVDTAGASEVALKALAVLEQIEREHRAEVEQLRRDNQQLAGQVGFLQARVQDQERQIALLMAPKDEAPAPPIAQTQAAPDARSAPEPAPRRLLWARVVRRLAGEP